MYFKNIVERYSESVCAAFRVHCILALPHYNNMGLLSDPNRRRALISLLTRLNAPIW